MNQSTYISAAIKARSIATWSETVGAMLALADTNTSVHWQQFRVRVRQADKFASRAVEMTKKPEVGMTRGEMDSAERRALNALDAWLDVTGVVERHTGYYYELQGVIKDAVHCGAQQALGIRHDLPSQMSGGWISYTEKQQ